MTLTLAFDAAFPPLNPYPNAGAVFGYLGGNTPHIWTPDEWRRFQNLKQMGIWVGFNEADPVGHGNDAVQAARSLGWTPNGNGATRRGIIIDFETEIDPAWIKSYADTVNSGGYDTFVYGSESFVLQNPVRSGRWIALYNDQPNIPADPGALAHQYVADVPWDGTQVDLSVVSSDFLLHFGYGPRHG